ncbi:GntR family transcriptional regulator [Celeribacter sp.]|uniref:GntR family transcriptional regulator n=1 Tax=Celeribacter sp. TaxID=1890673 RepID=UPI003A954BE0
MSLSSTISPAPSLADQAFAALVDAISNGELEPGSRIKEAEIARNLGISRGPLREALSRLESNGLVERKTNLGVSVTSLSIEDLDDLFKMREALEGQACGLAAERMTPLDITHLEEMLERHADTTAQTGHYKQMTADDDFHFFIIEKSGSRRLFRALCNDLYQQVRMYRHRSSSNLIRSETALTEHADIIRALASGNRRKAEDAMRLHISNARENVLWVENKIE